MTHEVSVAMKSRPSKVKAVVNQYNGGKYGRSGQYIAIIEPEYFKNGNYKKQSFNVVEVLKVVKKGYGYGNCNHSEQIADILEILGDEPNPIIAHWDAIVELMDDELREQVHDELAPCTEEEFFARYCELHEQKYGEPFEFN